MAKDRTGTTLGTYRLERLLGEGGMGQVYAATDEKLGRTVAIKVLRPEVMADSTHRARFEREAKALAGLNHPGIVTIYALEEADDVTYFAMDLVEGETLAAIIKREGGLPVSRILDLAIPISDAVAAAHKRGIAHRDLKPDNIIIGPRDEVTVLDFGLAKRGAASFESPEPAETAASLNMTLEGRIFGTVNYMAPEQAEAGETNLATDVFSLGVVIYEMATGQLPFQGASAMSVLSSILREKPLPMATYDRPVPPELETLVNRCLEKDPDRRWQSALDVRNELEILRDRLADPTAAAAATSGGTSTGRWIGIAAAGLLLGLGVGAGLALLDGRETGGTTSGTTVAATATPPQCVSISSPDGFEIVDMRLSPDADLVAMITKTADDAEEGTAMRTPGEGRFLHLRAIDDFDCRKVADSERILMGEFSPDGRSYMFVRMAPEANLPAKLMRLELDSDLPPVQVGTIPLSLIGVNLMNGEIEAEKGFAWMDDDSLVFVTSAPIEVVVLDARTGTERSRLPLTLPMECRPSRINEPIDERYFLLGVNYYDERGFMQDVLWVDRETGDSGVVVGSAPSAQVILGDQLLFTKGETLYRSGFDPKTRTMTGTAVPVFTGLRTNNSWSSGSFDAARDGSVVHLPGGLQGASRTLWTVDGERTQARRVDHPPRAFEEGIAVSRDGGRVVITHTNDTNDMWDIWAGTVDPPRIRRIQSFPDRDIHFPALSRDGTLAAAQISTTQPSRRSELVVFDPTFPGRDLRVVVAQDGLYGFLPYDIHPDNDRVVYAERREGGDANTLQEVSLEEGATPRQLLGGVALHQSARWSPDGRLMAWSSNESGVQEVFVAPYGPEGLGPVSPVSDGLAAFSGWSVDETGTTFLHYLVNNVEHVRSVEEVDGDLRIGPVQVTGRTVRADTFNLAMDEEGDLLCIRKGLNEGPPTRIELIRGFFTPGNDASTR